MKYNIPYIEKYQNENLNRTSRTNYSNIDDINDERNDYIGNTNPYQDKNNFYRNYQQAYKTVFPQTIDKDEEDDLSEEHRKIYFIPKKDSNKDNKLLAKKRKGSELPVFEIPIKRFKIENIINKFEKNVDFLPPRPIIINKNRSEKKDEERNIKSNDGKKKIFGIILHYFCLHFIIWLSAFSIILDYIYSSRIYTKNMRLVSFNLGLRGFLDYLTKPNIY